MWYRIGPFNVVVWVVSRHQRSQYWASWLSRHLLQRRKLVVNWSRWRLAGYSYRAVGAGGPVGAMPPPTTPNTLADYLTMPHPYCYFVLFNFFGIFILQEFLTSSSSLDLLALDLGIFLFTQLTLHCVFTWINIISMLRIVWVSALWCSGEVLDL